MILWLGSFPLRLPFAVCPLPFALAFSLCSLPFALRPCVSPLLAALCPSPFAFAFPRYRLPSNLAWLSPSARAAQMINPMSV